MHDFDWQRLEAATDEALKLAREVADSGPTRETHGAEGAECHAQANRAAVALVHVQGWIARFKASA